MRKSCFTCFLHLSQSLVTGIPLETSHQDIRPASALRPPWIRPVRKKASSSVRTDNSKSPSNSSQRDGAVEAFSPSDFFVDTPTSAHASGPASPVSPTTNQPQFSVAESFNSTFVNTTGILPEMRSESQMYLSPEILGLFDEGDVDLATLFSPITQLQASSQ